MPDSSDGAPFAPSDAQAAEQKMRRALGLHGNNRGASGSNQPRTPQQRPDQARQRHRFVQDGGVPVVVVNHRPEDGSVLKERIGDLERQLEHERAQHASTRRALAEAQAAANAIETRLVHANLAHQDALALERRALTSARQALNEALAQQAIRRSRTPAEPAPAPTTAAEASTEATAEIPVPREAPEPMTAKKRGRPRTRPLPEPKPVRWWTPSFRAKTKA